MKKFIQQKIFPNEIVRFLGIGAINLLFGYLLGILFLILLPFHYAISVLLATFIAVVFNYVTNSKFVFKSAFSSKKAALFFLNYVLIYTLNILLMTLGINLFDMNKVIAYVFSMPLLVIVTFIIQKNIIFKKT